MKRLFAIALVLLMLASTLAVAEEAPYLRQLQQNKYINTLFIPAEYYPEVRLSPSYFGSVLSGYAEPWLIRFGLPGDVYAVDFDLQDCLLVDEKTGAQYRYSAMDDYSFESLLNDCENDAYIVLDGSDGRAAYIDPEGNRAYGLIGVPEISKAAKLYVYIYFDNFLPSDDTNRRAEVLAQMISAETERIQAEMQVEQYADLAWTRGAYKGVKMPSLDENFGTQMMVFDFPQFSIKQKDDSGAVSDVAADSFLTSISGNHMGLCAFAGENVFEMEVDLDTYSYVVYQREEDPENVFSITLSDGSAFDIYMYDFADSGRSSSVYCSKLLSSTAGYNGDENYYLTLHITGDIDNSWSSADEVAALLEGIMAGVQFVDVVSDPYVPSETAPVAAAPAEAASAEAAPVEAASAEAAPAEAAPAEWVCANCQTSNSGNFCSNCGTGKPVEVSAEWLCAACNTSNTGNFCSNCGSARP